MSTFREGDRQTRHVEREFRYNIYLVGYGGERKGKREKGEKEKRGKVNSSKEGWEERCSGEEAEMCLPWLKEQDTGRGR